MKKKCLFWPYSWLFLIWLKLTHFQPNNGPHHHYNDVRSKIFFFFFLFLFFLFFFLPNTIIMEMGAIIWLKMSHFQPKNGPHPHYNDVRSIFFLFFSVFLEEKK